MTDAEELKYIGGRLIEYRTSTWAMKQLGESKISVARVASDFNSEVAKTDLPEGISVTANIIFFSPHDGYNIIAGFDKDNQEPLPKELRDDLEGFAKAYVKDNSWVHEVDITHLFHK